MSATSVWGGTIW